MEDNHNNMILTSINPTVGPNERPGLFSKLLFSTTSQEAKDPKGSPESSPPSHTANKNKKNKTRSKSTTPIRKRRTSSSPPRVPDEQLGRGLLEMAEAQASLGKWEKAFALWEEALKLQQRKLGEHHTTVASTLARRGSASAYLGHWYPAALDLEKAAHIYQNSLEENEVMASDTLIQLAEAQERMGRLDEAIANMEVALALKKKMGDEEGVARINCLIANVHHQQRDYERALQSYKIGLECYEQAGVDKNHPHVVWAARRASDRSMQGHLFWRSQAASGSKPTSR